MNRHGCFEARTGLGTKRENNQETASANIRKHEIIKHTQPIPLCGFHLISHSVRISNLGLSHFWFCFAAILLPYCLHATETEC